MKDLLSKTVKARFWNWLSGTSPQIFAGKRRFVKPSNQFLKVLKSSLGSGGSHHIVEDEIRLREARLRAEQRAAQPRSHPEVEPLPREN